MPIILEPVDNGELTKFFMGTKMSLDETSKESEPSESQFGCSQVVIVRTQEQKNRLPPVFENMLCLTVYESKGLEFNDVIIYNFFDESEAGQS